MPPPYGRSRPSGADESSEPTGPFYEAKGIPGKNAVNAVLKNIPALVSMFGRK